jgi:hypothetical protein
MPHPFEIGSEHEFRPVGLRVSVGMIGGALQCIYWSLPPMKVEARVVAANLVLNQVIYRIDSVSEVDLWEISHPT